MRDTLLVQVADSECNLSRIKLDNVLTESFLLLENFVQFTSFDEGHDKVEAELGLKQVVHSHEEGMIARKQYIFLQLCVVYLIILEQHVLADGFNRVQLLILLEFREVHLSEGSPA